MYNKKINKGSLMFTHGIQKRGISAIVATVLIILITVAASTILWVSVNSFVGDKLTDGTACLAASTGISLVEGGFTCWDATGFNFQLKLESGNVAISSLRVLVFDDALGSTTEILVDNFVMPTSVGGTAISTATLGGITENTKIQLIPYIGEGDGAKACEASATAIITACP